MLFIFIPAVSLISVLVVQFLLCKNVVMALMWPINSPLAFAITFITIIVASTFTLALVRSVRVATFLIQGSYVLLGVLSFMKRKTLGGPIYPWDFAISNEALRMVPAMLKTNPLVIVWFLLGIIGVLVITRLIPGSTHLKTWTPRSRLTVGFASFALLALLMLANNPLHDELFKHQFRADLLKPAQGFTTEGLLVSFVLLTEQGEVFPPADYNQAAAEALYREAQTSDRTPTSVMTPDIVVVMSESLFDPTELKGIHWKEDPLAFTRSVNSGRPLSLSVVPTFGYRTANSEFEFLTSDSVKFFAKGTIPYLALIQDHHRTLVDSVKEAGYRSVAIHPGVRDFYNREKVYDHFGFDQYISAEGFAEAKPYGNQISDESILPVLEKSLKRTEGPSFHFIVTIQNHYPYTANAFDFKDLLFDVQGLSSEEKIVLNYYSKVLKATDQFHKNLIETLKKRNRPTLLVIFGDHLPMLLGDFKMYQDRLIHSVNPADWTPDEKFKMFKTPLMIWSNFNYPDEKEPLSLSFLGARLLHQLHLPRAAFQKFIAQVSETTRLTDPTMGPPMSDEAAKALSKYKIFQYANFLHLFEPDFEAKSARN